MRRARLHPAELGGAELERQRHRVYDSVGGKPQTEWTTYRVSGPELENLARE